MNSARPSPAQRRVLQNLIDGRPSDHGINGRSAYGGFDGTISALFRRKWIAPSKPGQRDVSITEAGREAMRVQS